jgi:hypothetical protein
VAVVNKGPTHVDERAALKLDASAGGVLEAAVATLAAE